MTKQITTGNGKRFLSILNFGFYFWFFSPQFITNVFFYLFYLNIFVIQFLSICLFYQLSFSIALYFSVQLYAISFLLLSLFTTVLNLSLSFSLLHINSKCVENRQLNSKKKILLKLMCLLIVFTILLMSLSFLKQVRNGSLKFEIVNWILYRIVIRNKWTLDMNSLITLTSQCSVPLYWSKCYNGKSPRLLRK